MLKIKCNNNVNECSLVWEQLNNHSLLAYALECVFTNLEDIWSKDINNDRKARKIIVYFSDQGVHSGRDGAYAGLLNPSGRYLSVAWVYFNNYH